MESNNYLERMLFSTRGESGCIRLNVYLVGSVAKGVRFIDFVFSNLERVVFEGNCDCDAVICVVVYG